MHTHGKGGAYTRSHKPQKILYKKRAATKSEALKHEAEIKKWSRTKKITTLKLKL